MSKTEDFCNGDGMGGFYGSIHIRTDDAEAVRGALERLHAETKTRFLMAPPIDGWVSVFPPESGQDTGISEKLAALLDKPILHCLVHDDDVFVYQFYRSSALVDSYNSCPDYFGGEATERGGDTESLQPILADPAARHALKELLDEERFTFEVERLTRFAEILGLPNAVTSYEYLQGGERDDIQQWKQFIHIPDLSGEKAAAKAAKAKATTELDRLRKDGVLILDQADRPNAGALVPPFPYWAIDPTQHDVLLAWSGDPLGSTASTPVVRVNPQTGDVKPTNIIISDRVHSLAVSLDGRWLAAGCASGDWKAEVWEIASGRKVIEIPQSRAVDDVCFSLDGRTVFATSEFTLTIAPIDPLEPPRHIEMDDPVSRMALHPSGAYLAVVAGGMVSVVDLAKRERVATAWIPEPPGRMREIMDQVASSAVEQFMATIGKRLSAAELEKQRGRAARHFLPKQSVWSVRFGPSGNYLFCGATAGVFILDWAKVLAAGEFQPVEPAGFIRVKPVVGEGGSESQLIYSVQIDPGHWRILFAGLEGKVRFVDRGEGKLRDLLTPPIPMPFWKFEITPDRTALVGTAIPNRDKSGKPKPPHFQIWNYRALCEAAGVAW